MELSPGTFDVPPGMIATVVTYLEMQAPPTPRPVPDQPDLMLVKAEHPMTAWYRDLFSSVGADWLWFSRLDMDDRSLAAVLGSRNTWIYSVKDGKRDLGLLELDFSVPGECELAFFGLAKPLIGTGAGRWLMAQALGIAWDQPISRFHVHTCTLDSPAALSFYMRSGFKPVRQAIEIAPDPRLNGQIAPCAAPQIPLFGTPV
ncbi:MAG: GNAT family N-acetyltransferase [Pseudomonadota bacterium]